MYYKISDDTYIYGIGKGDAGEEIALEEYDAIMAAIQSNPQRTGNIGYRLKTDLTWEPYEMPPAPEPPEPEPTPEEALNILLGGGE